MNEWPLEWADLTCPRCGSEPGLDCRNILGRDMHAPHRERHPTGVFDDPNPPPAA